MYTAICEASFANRALTNVLIDIVKILSEAIYQKRVKSLKRKDFSIKSFNHKVTILELIVVK